jgi:hypothetical protein
MDWYKTLTIQQKINLKDLCELICGIKYTYLIKIFGMKETIQLIHKKMILEGYF